MKMIKLTLPFALFMLMGANSVYASGLSFEAIHAIGGLIEGSKQAKQYYNNTQGENQTVRTASTDLRKPGLCPEHYPMGMPIVMSAESDKLARRSFYLCQTGYAVQFDPATKTPLWVAERVTVAQTGAEKEDRTNDFRPNPDVPAAAQAALSDYKGSHFDRGHMAPAADQYGRSPSAMSESFYLTNMVPQVGPNQNRGIWADLENTVRGWARQRGEVLIVTGPIFAQGTVSMGRSKVWVPTHLYKVVLDPKTSESIAFIIPNVQVVTRKTRNLDEGNPQFPQTQPAAAQNCGNVCSVANFQVPVSAVEKATGIRFFSKMDQNTYNNVTQRITGSWKMR